MKPKPAASPGSQRWLREANRVRILDAVRLHGALTQVEIAAATGLSAASVSTLVRELAASGALALSPTIRSGRRATTVTLARRSGLLAGVMFEDRDVRVVLSDSARQVVGRRRLPLQADYQADYALDRAARLTLDIVDSVGARPADLRAVGVGLPAPVDSVSGQVGSESVLPGWRGLAVADAMQSLVGAPVVLDNNANLGALGELRHGVLQGRAQACYVHASHGVGAGLVINGAVYRGSAGTAGEIGHVTIDENGPICRCGNRGCLDTYVGARALLDALARSHGALTLRDVLNRASAGDPGCRRVLQDAGRHIGVALAGLVNLLNPEVIVIGGQLSVMGALVLDPVRESIERCAIPSAAASVTTVLTQLGEDAETTGALVAASQLQAATTLAIG
ncbi:MAG TPA: ROK family transcriptional regulator [Dermatophilaceae bacterium]|nr:ROK family transcriptional regulator [Dermatophilaceae bacterium]